MHSAEYCRMHCKSEFLECM